MGEVALAEQIIDEIVNITIPEGGIKMIDELPEKFRKVELTPMVGDMWNPSWEWKKINLKKYSYEELEELKNCLLLHYNSNHGTQNS